MRKEPILSVIVPIYNVEQYLAECLDSLISQTEKNIEILCIDDGSTDKSKSIVETYISLYDNIKLICQPNRGPSAARNTGIYNAKGTYIAFIDPDDTVSENMYQKMLTIANTHQLDLVMCGFKTIPDNNIVYPNFPANCVCSTLNFIKYNTKSMKVMIYVFLGDLYSKGIGLLKNKSFLMKMYGVEKTLHTI